MSLLKCQCLRNHANHPAAPRIQPFPELPLAAPVSPQPLLASPRRPPRFRLRHWRWILFSRFNHEIHIVFVPSVSNLETWILKSKNKVKAKTEIRRTKNHKTKLTTKNRKQETENWKLETGNWKPLISSMPRALHL
jgi:hypothetical protein